MFAMIFEDVLLIFSKREPGKVVRYFVAYAIAADFPGFGVWRSVFGGSVIEFRGLERDSSLTWQPAFLWLVTLHLWA